MSLLCDNKNINNLGGDLMGKDKLGAFIDAVYAITITICIINIEKPTSLEWGALWSVRDSLITYTITFFMMISMWIQIHHLWNQIVEVDNGVIWTCMIFLFTSSFIPYTTSLMMESNFENRYFAVVYGLLTVFISLNLLFIQIACEKCNEKYLGKGKNSKIMPSRAIMSFDIFIKIVGILISVFLWAPFIIIAVWVAFEFNSLATRILQKKMAKKIEEDIHEDELIEETSDEEC